MFRPKASDQGATFVTRQEYRIPAQYAEAARLERVARLWTQYAARKPRSAGRNGRVWHQSGRFANVFLRAWGFAAASRPGRRPARLRANSGGLRFRHRLVDTCGTLWLCAADARAAGNQQRPQLFQLVQSRRYQTRPG